MIEGGSELISSELAAFDYQPRTRIVFGIESSKRVGELAKELGLLKVLLVTDPGIVAAGHAKRVQESLGAAGVEFAVFDRVRENPGTSCVDACLAVAKEARVDGFIGLGGGSSMDTAKGCNFLLTNGGRMQDYWGTGKAKQPMRPFIAIPTTAGTGSECQSAALITDEQTHQKMACLDQKATARIAILDPALTLSQPAKVTAVTGIDALAHALETAVSTRRNPFSAMLSAEAFRLCSKALEEVMVRPDDVAARGRMLLGASLAGLAIENSMLGAAHAAANPLTAHFGVIHGLAVGMMLPGVIRFNGSEPEIADLYINLIAHENRVVSNGMTQKLAERIETFVKLAKLPVSLAKCGVDKKRIPELAEEASRQWTAGFNPRKVGQSDFERLYEEAY
jgi:alcohol dehydrogenase